MARTSTWRRTRVVFAPTGNAVSHDYAAIGVFAGETVTRIHLHWQAVTYPAIPLAPWGFEGVLGVRVQNDLSTVPTLSPLDDISSEEWMHHEGWGWRQEAFAYSTLNGDLSELVSAPTDGGYRDIKAQRRVLADGAIWVQDSAAYQGSNQGNHYLSFTIAALILLPA